MTIEATQPHPAPEQTKNFIGARGRLKKAIVEIDGVEHEWIVKTMNWKDFNEFMFDVVKDSTKLEQGILQGAVDAKKFIAFMERQLRKNIVRTPDGVQVDDEYVEMLDPIVAEMLFQEMLPEIRGELEKK